MPEIPPQAVHAAAELCRWFRWIGQPWTSCDGCGRPAWEHDGQLVTGDGGMFGPLVGQPWGEGEADRMRAHFDAHAAPEPATTPQTAPQSTETGATGIPRDVGWSDNGTSLATPTALRDLYAEAAANAECDQTPRCAYCIAGAVLAVRDDELAAAIGRAEQAEAEVVELAPVRDSDATGERLRRERNQWREQCERAEAEIGRLHAAIHVVLHNETDGECQHYGR